MTMKVDSALEGAPKEVGALPLLIEQDGEDTDSDSDADLLEVEDSMTPEDDVILVAGRGVGGGP